MPPPSSRTGVPPCVSVPVTGLRFPPGAEAVDRPKPNALKAGFPCRKLWILDSKLLDDKDGSGSGSESMNSGSAVKSMSLWRAWTRAEAGLEVRGGAGELIVGLTVELCEGGTGTTEEGDGL